MDSSGNYVDNDNYEPQHAMSHACSTGKQVIALDLAVWILQHMVPTSDPLLLAGSACESHGYRKQPLYPQ